MEKDERKDVPSSAPIEAAQAPSRSGLQSSVSTKSQPGERENVRLLLHTNREVIKIELG